MRLSLFGLGVRQPSPLLGQFPAAWDAEMTQHFHALHRRTLTIRGTVCFVALVLLTLIANQFPRGVAVVLSLVSAALLLTMFACIIGSLRLGRDRKTLRSNPWMECEARKAPLQLFGFTVGWVVEFVRDDWPRAEVRTIARSWGDVLVIHDGLIASAGEPGNPLLIAPLRRPGIVRPYRWRGKRVRAYLLKRAFGSGATRSGVTA